MTARTSCPVALPAAPSGAAAVFGERMPLAVRFAGEVIGIAGVAGNGQGEFFEAVSGEVLQQEPARCASAARTPGGLGITGRRLLGAAFVPEERLGHGAAPRMKLSENLLLSRHATDRKAFLGAGGMVKTRRDRRGRRSASSRRWTCARARRDPEAAALSGGNLQKFIVGRELDRSPAVHGRQPADLGRRCRRCGRASARR